MAEGGSAALSTPVRGEKVKCGKELRPMKNPLNDGKVKDFLDVQMLSYNNSIEVSNRG